MECVFCLTLRLHLLRLNQCSLHFILLECLISMLVVKPRTFMALMKYARESVYNKFIVHACKRDSSNEKHWLI